MNLNIFSINIPNNSNRNTLACSDHLMYPLHRVRSMHRKRINKLRGKKDGLFTVTVHTTRGVRARLLPLSFSRREENQDVLTSFYDFHLPPRSPRNDPKRNSIERGKRTFLGERRNWNVVSGKIPTLQFSICTINRFRKSRVVCNFIISK